MIPSELADAFGGKWPQALNRTDAYAAARGKRRRTIAAEIDGRFFIGVTREFGNAPECAETPLGLGVLHLIGNELQNF
jgi:hypothetical protein